jgi:signal transduction histidine kinase
MQKIRPRPSADPARNGVLARRQVLGTVMLGVLLASASLAGLYTIYDRSRAALDAEMGSRLAMVAEQIAAEAVPESLLQWVYQERDELLVNTASLRARLDWISEERGLNYVVIYSFEGEVLVDTSGLREVLAPDPYLLGDEREAAFRSVTSHTPTREVGAGLLLKTAYAAILSAPSWDVAPLGHVAVHAAPSFFATLRALRDTLVGVGLGVVALLSLLVGLYLFFAQRLARAHAALQRTETLTAMGRMAAGIAHEIRNPLGIIKNTAQLLREELQDAGVQSDLVGYIPEEVDRLNETLTGYLEFAKDAPLRLERFDLVPLVRRTLHLVGRELDRAGVRVLDNLDEVGQLGMRADRRRLQQVLLNLVLNAVQAMPDGGELRIVLADRAREVGITIADTGVGMDVATAEQVFEPFVTTKEKGSGLGLYMVRRIVEEHGGRLELETAMGEGTAFTVVLPAPGAEG